MSTIFIMASRSFKPASYLARPPFTRSSSSSSARSEDAIIASLKASSIDHKEDKKAKGKENSNTSSPGTWIGRFKSGMSPVVTGEAPNPTATYDRVSIQTPTAVRKTVLLTALVCAGHNTSTSRSHFEEVTTPGRKRSAPIAIELPGREPRPVYTPLSARGDLPG